MSMDSICLELINSVLDTQKNLVVIFKDEEVVLTNEGFNSFVGVSSFEQYSESFGPFVENFVPHPSYFNKDKIVKGELWFDSIMNLAQIDRVVSMLNADHDPYAFSVNIINIKDGYRVVILEDITQDLIKRIMIENHANIDLQSGAYAKDYFLQIVKSYEEAAHFNEKILGATSITLLHEEINSDLLKEFTRNFKNGIRQDDILIRWSRDSFLLLFATDDQVKAQQVAEKLQILSNNIVINGLECKLSSAFQEKGESINRLIKRVC